MPGCAPIYCSTLKYLIPYLVKHKPSAPCWLKPYLVNEIPTTSFLLTAKFFLTKSFKCFILVRILPKASSWRLNWVSVNQIRVYPGLTWSTMGVLRCHLMWSSKGFTCNYDEFAWIENLSTFIVLYYIYHFLIFAMCQTVFHGRIYSNNWKEGILFWWMTVLSEL